MKNPAGVDLTISKISASPRLLVSGTATVIVKNNAGSTIASVDMTTAAVLVEVNPSISTWSSGDNLRFGLTGLGVGLVDVSVTVWIKMPSTA